MNDLSLPTQERTIIPVAWLLGPYRRRWRRRPVLHDSLDAPFEVEASGATLRGVIHHTNPDAPFLIHYYGAGMNAAAERGRLSWLAAGLGLNVVCVDYRGYGRSGGRFAVARLQEDAVAVYDAVRALAGDAPIHVHGFSMGSAIAVHVSAVREVASIVLLAPPASARELRTDMLARWTILRAMGKFTYIDANDDIHVLLDTARTIRRVKHPLLVIHGDCDRTIDIRQGLQVFNASPAINKRFVQAQACTHCNLPYAGGIYAEVLSEWFSSGFGLQYRITT